MLPVEYRVDQLKLHNMFDIIHGTAPVYLSSRLMRDHTVLVLDQVNLVLQSLIYMTLVLQPSLL